MSREKKLEKIIDVYRSLLSIVIVALFGLVGFLFVNADSMSFLQICVVAVAIGLDVIAIGVILWFYVKYLNELEEA